MCLDDIPKKQALEDDDEIQVIEPKAVKKQELPHGVERIKMDMQPLPKKPLS